MKRLRFLSITAVATSLFFLFLPFNVIAQEDFGEEVEVKLIDNTKVYEDAATISDTINQNETKSQNVEKGSAKALWSWAFYEMNFEVPEFNETPNPFDLLG